MVSYIQDIQLVHCFKTSYEEKMPATKRKTAVVDKAPATKEEAVGGEEVSNGDDSNVVRTLNVEACKSWLVSLRLFFFVPFVAHIFCEH